MKFGVNPESLLYRGLTVNIIYTLNFTSTVNYFYFTLRLIAKRRALLKPIAIFPIPKYNLLNFLLNTIFARKSKFVKFYFC
ncbi:hypothetical protein RhiirC2_728082 [Rhizophagus irregularis]|uniref:Uncharacterized protein n=1 Tax=Rhizophagus irregularis TaxID=588596 RepID=A0A2N1NZ13_9GLOM|nr:hypothetical protein RhiirC2_728082 [Rhizophagus irregularis]